MSKRWIYSDPHYHHGNVIEYANRPFNDVNHMNKEMIKRHNFLINKQDKVFILGDFCFSDKKKTKEIVSQLKGNLVLIIGNHDRCRSVQWWYDVGFKEVIKYPIIVNEKYILSHEPIMIDRHSDFINLHGHIHEKSYIDENGFKSKNHNLCVEQTDYFPIDLNKLINSLSP